MSSEKGISVKKTQQVVPYLQEAATTPLQYSAQKGAMVAMASQGRAKRLGHSDFSLFLDIASAYCTLLRQHAVHLLCGDEDVVHCLHRIGMVFTARRPRGDCSFRTPACLSILQGEKRFNH